MINRLDEEIRLHKHIYPHLRGAFLWLSWTQAPRRHIGISISPNTLAPLSEEFTGRSDDFERIAQ